MTKRHGHCAGLFDGAQGRVMPSATGRGPLTILTIVKGLIT